MRQLSLLLLAAAAFAANQMEAPSLGWVYDKEAKTVHRLTGLPGGLGKDAPLDIGSDILTVWIAPGQDVAVLSRQSAPLEKRNLATGAVERLEVDAPEEVLFSPDGKQIGLWWKSTSRFALWGESPTDLSAKSILLRDDGEQLLLAADGNLRSSRGPWLGDFGPTAVLSSDNTRVFVTSKSALTVFTQSAKAWQQSSRIENSDIDSWLQVEPESAASWLVVTNAGALERWFADGSPRQTLAPDSVLGLTRLRLPGFYLTSGDSPRLLFALSESQKLYTLPATEVRQ